MNNNIKAVTLLVGGIIIGSVLTYTMTDSTTTKETMQMETPIAEKKPLYWVAPMDANYRRDQPGKSPMGMDLVPFYGDLESDSVEEENSIRISPDVVNNLGVRTSRVMYKALHSEIKTVGYVQYDEDRLIHIHPRVEGWIEKLYIKTTGDPITIGQPIYEIYSPALVNAQEEMLLALDRKNPRLIKASEDRLRSLQLPVQTIKNLKKTKKVKQTITFFAPQTGVVDNLNIREGFYVKPGTTLMSIGSLEEVWVVAEVFERQASQVIAGMSVSMSLDYLSGQSWHGSVDYVYPALDPKTRTVKIRLRFNNKDNVLKPNMFAQVVIHAESSDETLLVPKEAVIRSGDMDRVVLALGEGRFKSVEVKLGRFDEQFTEILSGLSEGEEVVTSAQFLLDSESSKNSDFKRMAHDDSSENGDQSTIDHSTMDHSKMNHSTDKENGQEK